MVVSFNDIKRLIFNRIGPTPVVFGVIVCSKVLGFRIGPVDLMAYACYIIGAIWLLLKKPKFDTLSLLFIIYLPITIILGDPSPIFRSWPRYLSFLMVFICASPFLRSERAIIFRNKILVVIVSLCALTSIISFACYFLGINMMKNMVTGFTLDYITNTAGTFGGITNQSMLLGPISGVGVIVSSYMALRCKKRVFGIIAVICGGSLLFAASRSALIATLSGELWLLLNFTKNKDKNVKKLLGIVILGIITFPVWNNALDGINSKNKGDIQSGISMDTRQAKWEIRIEEWESSPIIGIGFVAVSDRDVYTIQGVIEPGSSWLGVLSMSGAIGFILFVSLYYRALKKSLKDHSSWGAMMGGLLVLTGVHMLAEGHVFSGGSFLCFLSWLIIGCATDVPSNKWQISLDGGDI